MDILTHIAAGIAIGTTITICTKGSALKKIGIVLAGALGGALPDTDAVSMWSKFDVTFGKLFGLQHTGCEIYSAKFWYSHHGFMHSLLASVVFGFILLLIAYLLQQRFRKQKSSFCQSFKRNIYIFLSFISGFIAHLLCDMLTPAATWGGVNLFYPLNTYTGGWGKIWWWNNYDVFLIINTLITTNILILFISQLTKAKLKIFSITVFVLAFAFIVIQVNTRKFDFNHTCSSAQVYQKYEAKSKEIQENILGKKLYNSIKQFDNSVSLNF
ncbi:MAG: metal-dependent hydrolase [Prevotellaceae bacterium]|jgi:membrane-bound metal-dependent hydrolase YbcI (DUF457 family)|nr:metal-dependent hydrolase [Prevotellaceae bacterium]